MAASFRAQNSKSTCRKESDDKALDAKRLNWMMGLKMRQMKMLNTIWYKLHTNRNNQDQVSFLLNNTDSYISRLTATFVFCSIPEVVLPVARLLWDVIPY